jgi:RNA polymerase sigma factor (sigma-70 family)
MIAVDQTQSQDPVLEGLRREDRRITEQFYRQLWQRTSRYLLPRYGRHHRELLADCLSDAFLVLLAKIQDETYVHRNLKGFAFGIVRNTFRDALRRRSLPEFSTAPEDVPERPFLPESSSYATAADWLEDLDRPVLLVWWKLLSQEDRQFLDLRLQGFNQQEIAALYNITYGAIRNRFSTMFKLARQLLLPDNHS